MRGVAGLNDVLEMVRRGSDQVDMRATISDAAGPDDNFDPLGLGDDSAGCSDLGDDGLLPLTPTRKLATAAANGGNRHQRRTLSLPSLTAAPCARRSHPVDIAGTVAECPYDRRTQKWI